MYCFIVLFSTDVYKLVKKSFLHDFALAWWQQTTSPYLETIWTIIVIMVMIWWSLWLTWLSACRSSRGGNRRRHPISGPHRTSAAKEVIGFHCHCHQWWERSGSRCNDNHLVTTATQHWNADSGLRFSSAKQHFALVHFNL